MSEEIEKIKEQLIHPKAIPLTIKRVPIDIAQKFKQLANDEFCGDYGMCLKMLYDSFEEQNKNPVLETLREHEQRILKLEATLTSAQDKQDSEVAKALGGRIIRRKRGEQNE